jgi:glycosyltransferase involved in cell wall biosynthesis
MDSKKIKVLVVPSDRFGVGYYRSVNPHTYLDKLFGNEFDVEINYEPNFLDLESFNQYDIIHIHKGLINNMKVMWDFLDYCKTNNIVTVMDIDDNWDVGPQHPLYASLKNNNVPSKIVENIKRFDYITTTTEIFADKIKQYNKNVFVFPNAIDPDDEQYKPIKNPSNKIRFGFVMGSAHEKDMEQFKGVFASLPKDVRDKMQVVLCGYDLRGQVSIVDKEGNIVNQRPISPTESVWYSYEKTCTNNYSLCSEEYKNFLHNFLKDVQWPFVENEFYRREWTKDVTEFAKHYRNLDVLFAPLDCNDFNKVKSELKFIEAGFTNTAVIATNYGPYTIGSKSMFNYGGEIDETGNCVLIDDRKKHKDWKRAIVKLVNNPELITKLKENLYNTVKDKYNINNVTKNRAEWYKSILKK